ncbi:MAG TPA: hypothetical protein VGP91_16265 [Actinoplanes sp.]|jgi:hypothetical protein|nr:hypothetical protein [Actinoplanes sp.]
MSQFYVDVGGLNGMYNMLARAAGDASDTLDYTKAHCDLDWNAEGLLMILMGPHEHLYENRMSPQQRAAYEREAERLRRSPAADDDTAIGDDR